MAKKFNLDKMLDDLKGQANSSTQKDTNNQSKSEEEIKEQARISMVLPADLWKMVRLLAISRGSSATKIVRDLLDQEIRTATKKGEIPILP